MARDKATNDAAKRLLCLKKMKGTMFVFIQPLRHMQDMTGLIFFFS